MKRLLGKFDRRLFRLGGSKNRRGFVYLHMPKTAGSAVKHAVRNSHMSSSFIVKPHATAFKDLTRSEKRCTTFATIRRPLEWYLSVYNFKMRSGGQDKYCLIENNSFEDFVADVILCENGLDGIVKWNRPIQKRTHILRMAEIYFSSGASEHIGFCTLNFLYYTTQNWQELLRFARRLSVDDLMESGGQSVDYVLRQELLSVDVKEMLKLTNLELDLSSPVNKMPNNPYADCLLDSIASRIYERDGLIYSLFYS